MLYDDRKERETIAAIQLNHRMMLQTQMVTHFNLYLNQSESPKQIYSWVEAIDEVRLLSANYLDTVAQNSSDSTEETIANNSTVGAYFTQVAKAILPVSISSALFDNPIIDDQHNLFNSISKSLFSLALGRTVTTLLFDSFEEFSGKKEDLQKQFNDVIEKKTKLSQLILQESERIATDLIKLFHFREMLLLGKKSDSPIEPDARVALLNKVNLENEPTKAINLAIEVYFARELSNIFNNGFKSFYQVEEYEISKEMSSTVKSWFGQLFSSADKRHVFTQDIQLKFMQLASEFLLEQKNQMGFLGKHPLISALIVGVVATGILAAISSFIVSAVVTTLLAIVGFALTTIGTYYLIPYSDRLNYQRDPENRGKLQEAINRIDSEFLRLHKENAQQKETSALSIKSTRKFERFNAPNLLQLDSSNVARGSVSGWLREYASRYRHSKAIEIDLGHEYKQLMTQSRIQSRNLVNAINKKQLGYLDTWINNSRTYLKTASHQSVIKDFELIPKMKEQVLDVISETDFVPLSLRQFYCAPISQGGLGGNQGDFEPFRRFAPSINKINTEKNPYAHLCETAIKLFKNSEPYFAKDLILYGDADYRQMLGIPRGNYSTPITNDNMDSYLKNSYAFLLSLFYKLEPGLNLDPLQQNAMVSDEFYLYRMLLLKQLAGLCSFENKEHSVEVKEKIKTFISQCFKIDPEVILDDLLNQSFLLNHDVQTSKIYHNSNDFTVLDIELDNMLQALSLDIAYNSTAFKLNDILKYYMDDFSKRTGNKSAQYFASNLIDQELTPQGTQHFVDTVEQYCEHTKAFLNDSATNKGLTINKIFDCYKYNVSLQVYKAMLRIVKDVSDLSKYQDRSYFVEQSNYLLVAFDKLRHFAHRHCFYLHSDSKLIPIIDLIKSKKIAKSPLKDWAGELSSAVDLAKDLTDIPSQVRYPPGKKHEKTKFFKAGNAASSVNEEPANTATTSP